MEMKAEIIQRLQGPKAGQLENTNNFHNLYVKRHTNVRYGIKMVRYDNKIYQPHSEKKIIEMVKQGIKKIFFRICFSAI